MSGSAPFRLLPLGAALVVLFAACDSSPPRPSDEELIATTKKQAKPFYDMLGKIAASFPDAAEAKRCDDAAIEKASPDESAREVVTVYWGDLARITKTKVEANEHDLLFKVTFSNHLFDHGVPLDEVDRQSRSSASLAQEQSAKRPYLAVTRVALRRDGTVVDTKTMTAGLMQLTVAVFDVRNGEAVCWTKLDVDSSDSVTYRHHEDANDEQKKRAAEEALERDLQGKAAARVREEFPKMTAALRLPDNFDY